MIKYLLMTLLFLIPITSVSQSVKTYIPERAFQYLPIVYSEAERLMPDMPYPYYFGSLIEHESCISLKHSRCWSPTSRLKTSREEGAGLIQITRAYNSNGTLRFDTLSELRRSHIQELRDLSWGNVYQRPDLQIRAGILLTKRNHKALHMVKDPWERLAMTDSAYNGGLGHVNKDRRLCGLKANCDPQKWFSNVELHSVKSRKPLYAGRSAYTINRQHVHDTLYIRMPKYQKHYKENLM
ncbi:MAG: hypothetical protein M0Q87_13200 [Ottowia sp.]|nr:hypothetical protein [Ottowia sp.]